MIRFVSYIPVLLLGCLAFPTVETRRMFNTITKAVVTTLSLEPGSKMLPSTPRDFELQAVGGAKRHIRFEGKSVSVEL